MEIYTKEQFLSHKEKMIESIRAGAVFIHPTDTIYGLGCSALLPESVQRIRQIKQRHTKPLSVWAPDKKWIEKNCILNQSAREWLDKLPGKYTLILRLKKKGIIPAQVNCGADTIGVRIPESWFSAVVKEIGVPIVTTSVNVSGKRFMTSIKDLNPGITGKVDFIVYEGTKKSTPSQIIDLSREKPVSVER